MIKLSISLLESLILLLEICILFSYGLIIANRDGESLGYFLAVTAIVIVMFWRSYWAVEGRNEIRSS